MLSLLTNVPSLTAKFNLSNAQNALATTLQRLSSGLRINSAADDPAGLIMSQLQQAQLAGMNAALKNTNNANSLVQIASGALNETSALLLQIRSLAVDAASAGTGNPGTVSADQAQITAAINTITGIATSTAYGNTQLLDGTKAASATTGSGLYTATAQGAIGTGSYTVAVTSPGTAATVTAGANVNTTGAAETLTINGTNIAIAASSSLTNQLAAINAVTGTTGVGAVANGTKIILYATSFGTGHLISVSSSAGTGSVTGLTAAGTVSVDGTNIAGTIAGYAATGSGNVLTASAGPGAGLSVTVAPDSTTTYTSASNNPFTTDAAGTTVTVNAAGALQFQIGSNAGQTVSLSVPRAAADSIGTGVSSTFANLSQINVSNSANSAAALTVIDKAISDVANMAGTLGAFQNNTLQATATNLQNDVQNTTTANSLIRDTNFAAETANYTQEQVLVQAGTQVLKNANLLPQLVLTLLQ